MAKVKARIVEPEKYPIEDIRTRLGQMKLKEGENVIHEESDGSKLLVDIVNGVRAGWRAVDGQGREVQVVYIREPETHDPGPTARPKVLCKVCACFETGNKCWWVNC